MEGAKGAWNSVRGPGAPRVGRHFSFSGSGLPVSNRRVTTSASHNACVRIKGDAIALTSSGNCDAVCPRRTLHSTPLPSAPGSEKPRLRFPKPDYQAELKGLGGTMWVLCQEIMGVGGRGEVHGSSQGPSSDSPAALERAVSPPPHPAPQPSQGLVTAVHSLDPHNTFLSSERPVPSYR